MLPTENRPWRLKKPVCETYYYATDSFQHGSRRPRKLCNGGQVRKTEQPTSLDVVELQAQADASLPASNNNVNYTIYFNF